MTLSEYPVRPLSPVSVADLAWLHGAWLGRRGGDLVEEHWSDVAGGAMMGMFRWLQAGQVRFYELLTLEQDAELVVMRIKHFHPGLRGWEEKDDAVAFTVVRLDQGEVVLLREGGTALWLVYRLEGPNALVTYFETEGETHTAEDEFRYTRVS